MVDKNLTLSTKVEPEKDDPGFLLALVLNFQPTLGAMTKDINKTTPQNQGQTALRRVRDKIIGNFWKIICCMTL